MSITEEHFALQEQIERRYRERDRDPTALREVIAACEAQISMAVKVAEAFRADDLHPLPRHIGFERLAIIHEKREEPAEALRISEEAKRQGWAGDWENRIKRLRKKASK